MMTCFVHNFLQYCSDPNAFYPNYEDHIGLGGDDVNSSGEGSGSAHPTFGPDSYAAMSAKQDEITASMLAN